MVKLTIILLDIVEFLLKDVVGKEGNAHSQFIPYSNKQTFTIKKPDCVNAQTEISADQAAPPKYKLFGGNNVTSFNCASWARKILRTAGIGLSTTSLSVDLPSQVIEEAKRYKEEQGLSENRQD